MCGIAGILTDDPTLAVEDALDRMRIALRHRGPDGEGSVVLDTPCGKRIGLAHTRLAILDLTDAGQQPMCDEEADSWIVYNGEVYNHEQLRVGLDPTVFRSRTDTETVLQSWKSRGRATLDELRGMFAFALYDARRQQLTLARDRLGIKPLYVARCGATTWLFASELRAILATGLIEPSVDRNSLRSYLAYGAIIAPHTAISNVQSLLPAETWTFNLAASDDEPRRQHYWTPWHGADACDDRDDDSTCEALRDLLLESARLRTLSDVPLGVFLSGGIDSSAVVASLVHEGFRPRTFSVAFAEDAFDESSHSRLVARQFQTEHTELHLGPTDVLRGMDDALSAYDQPSMDGINTYFISRCVRDAGVKVALSGLGGDELFAGYPSFRAIGHLRSPRGRLMLRLAGLALRGLQPNHVRTAKMRAMLQAHGPLERYAICRRVADPVTICDLLDEGPSDNDLFLPSSTASLLAESVESMDGINAHSCLELAVYMANTLLRDTDQMSMAHALEVRVPLIDHTLVESVIGLAGRKKLRSQPKQLLLQALPTPLPPTVWRRRKMGFTFPWDRWLRGGLRETIEGRVHEKGIWQGLGIHPSAVLARWRAFLAGHPGVRHSDILCLVHLADWSTRHASSTPNRKITVGTN